MNDRRPPWALLAAAAVLAALGLVMVVLRVVPSLQADVPGLGPVTPVILVASFIPYGALAWLLALVLLLVAWARWRRPRGRAWTVAALLLAAGLMMQVAWLVPFFVPDQRPSAGDERLTVATINTRVGRADLAALQTATATADVVVLAEATPDVPDRLSELGWDARFGYRVGDGWPGGLGTIVYSRFPVTAFELMRFVTQQWVITLTVPGLGAVNVLAVHPCNPAGCGALWLQAGERISEGAAGVSGPTVIAGDFNAVDDHVIVRRLIEAGFRDAADVVGAGWLPTYPAGGRFPAVLPIDHIMINDELTALELHRLTVPGTDHHGLLAVLARAG